MKKSLRLLLCAAYKTELKALAVLKGQSELDHHTDVQERINDHIVKTEWQLKLLTACLEFQDVGKHELEGEPQELAGKADLLSINKFEISLYKRLIATARVVHAPEILKVCEEILEQEIALAEWVEDNFLKIPPDFMRPAKAAADVNL